LANSGSSCLVGTGLQRTLEVCLEARCGSDRVTARVVDDLRINVLRRTVDRKTRTIAGDLLDLTTNARGAALNAFFGGHSQNPCLEKRGWPYAVSDASRDHAP